MAFSQSTITSLSVIRDGTSGDMLVSWTCSLADPQRFQLYYNRRLAWTGFARQWRHPWPSAPVDIQVGTILDTDMLTDFSGSLPAVVGSGRYASLTWNGGTYLDPDIAGFYIFSSLSAGGSISYTAPIATVPAYTGVPTDGYGQGGYGQGGYGFAGASYGWTSAALSPGVWSFAVCPFDGAGNVRTPGQTCSVTITGPPNAPAPFASDGLRVHRAYNPSTHAVTLTWQAPP